MPARGPLEAGTATAFAATWAVWLLAGLGAPLPPWSAARTLAEEQRAVREALLERTVEGWTLDVGDPASAAALGVGWSGDESFRDGERRRRFAWIAGEAAQVDLVASGWSQTVLSLRAAPLEELAPLAVDVEIDGEPRARLQLTRGWRVHHASLGGLAAGAHTLRLRPARRARPAGERRTLSAAVAGIALGPRGTEEPERSGPLAGWVRLGLDDRPALLLPSGAAAVAGCRAADAPPGWTAWTSCAGRPPPRRAHAAAALAGLAAGLAILVVSGLGWATLAGARGPGRLIAAVAASSLVLLAALLALRGLGWTPGPISLSAALLLGGGLPLLAKGARAPLRLEIGPLVAGLAAALVACFFAGAVVPPLTDQDLEVQATAHALATRQLPLAVTDRGTAYFFAHPPLLHLWAAGSASLSGRLPELRHYHEAAVLAAAGPFRRPAPDRDPPFHDVWQAQERRLLTRGLLWPTRQLNAVATGLGVGLLAWLAGRLAGSALAGVALALVYASFPELLVRGAYGGYYAASALATLLVLAALREHPRAGAAVAGGLAGLANQKCLLVPGAWLLVAPHGAGRARWAPAAGAAGGLALFALWGLALAPEVFAYDFLERHVLRPLALSDLRFAAGGVHFYPSIAELWREFAASYGWVFLLAAALATLRGLRAGDGAVRAAAAAVLIGAVVFSLTDWRQTKHLALLVAPALVAIAGAWPGSSRGRRAALMIAAALLLRNLWTGWPLLGDFEALRPSSIW